MVPPRGGNRGRGARDEAGGSGGGGSPAADDTPQDDGDEQEGMHGHGGGDIDGRHGDDAAGGDMEQDAAETEPTEEQLREVFDRDKRAVDYLLHQGFSADDPVLAAAEAQLAEAKRRWQAAKPGVAVTTRMVWAEQALTRARRGQAKLEQSIDDLDQKYEFERDQLLLQLAEARGRTREREAKLEEVSRQAAAEFSATDCNEGEPLRRAADTLETQLAPAFQELLDLLPADSPARSKAEGVIGLLNDVHGTVDQAYRARGVEKYDIGNTDGDMDWERGTGDGWDHYGGYWEYGDEDGWYRDGWGDWRRWATYPPAEYSTNMDTADVQVPHWMDPAADAQQTQAAARAWKRGRWYGEDPNGSQGRNQGGGDGGDRDHENTARLQAAIGDATIDAVEPAPPTPNVADAELNRRRQEVWDLAQDQGVEVTAAAVAQMVSEELEEWATANLL